MIKDLNWPGEIRTLDPDATLETSSGSETVLFLSKALSCSDLNQLLHHAGKALRRVRIHLFRSLLGANPHSTQLLPVSDIDLSRNIGLQTLHIEIAGSDAPIPTALLEREETYGVVQRMISSTSPTVLEQISINVGLNKLDPSAPAASPSIMSHVLFALHRAICPPDQPLVPDKYTSMKLVVLRVRNADETSKRQMEADWDRLAPIWFPSFYSRGIINLKVHIKA
ncbi:hypothetical protein WOLCODRAFT_136945 [Wolfiporia cocos MD-104 SS10]|uniref:Uncharacterized protein n=1 Tax=Wolfiporia cocos (strain MD-104) TaxID=742152 RepID=A0A2H3JGM5_WOLCO|nr:hypothetical protein WOLCODRAFT_136945 [Wolfiporia cocos MD-104 SS10]